MRIPATASTVLIRDRLHVLMDAAIADMDVGPSVTVVCAPAGSGKTTLLASWARQRVERSGSRIAWVSVGAEDNDPGLLWTAILRSLEASGAWAIGPTSCGLTPPSDEPHTDFLAMLITAVERLPEPLILILDGVHDLTSKNVVRSVNFLLRHSPATLRVVLAARFPPPLILPRLRVEGRLHEIGQSSLTFTATEARLVYAREGVQLTSQELRRLMELTEGWAAGLRLAVIMLEDNDSPGELMTRFSGEDPVVADYLVGEVVASQAADVQEFMLATSVCPTFSAPLAAELTQQENAGQILDWLERTGIVASEANHAERNYRYHPLLRTYLRAELGRRQQSALHQRHRTVAWWYVTAGDGMGAIEHAAAAGDDDLLARLIAKFGLAQVLDGRAEQLRAVLDATSAHVLRRPSVALVAAATALEVGDIPAADRLLRTVDTPAHPLRTQRLRALHAAVGLVRKRLGGDLGEAFTTPKIGQTGDLDVDLLALVNRGISATWAGRHDIAKADLHRALDLAEAERRDIVTLRCETHLASVAVAEGDLVTMGIRVRSALAIANTRKWTDTSNCAYPYALLGLEAYERSEDQQAQQLAMLAGSLLDGPNDRTVELFVVTLEALTHFDDANNPHQVVGRLRDQWQRLGGTAIAPALVAYTAPARQRMALLVGEAMWASEVLEQVETWLGDGGERALLRAILHAHRGKVGMTRRMLAAVLEGAVSTVAPSTILHAWLLEAYLADRCDESGRVHEALSTALAMAAPNEALRPFRDAGPSIRTLLAAGAGRFGRLESFAGRVLSRLPVSIPDPRDGLTEREKALLAELPSMRTAEEIAHTMFVSVNTVKTHLRGIYRKLGVNHRRDAITVARQRGLL